MSTPTNSAAWLDAASQPLRVGSAPLPTPGPSEIVIKNSAVAINPLDCHMQDHGVFVTQWPTIFGCDVAGTVHSMGSEVHDFKVGDRVIGHTTNLVTGLPSHGAYALYTAVPASKAAILPSSISFTDGVVVPFALEAAVCALSLKIPGQALPGVPTPALGLPYPSLDDAAPIGKTLVVNGASSSVGSMVVQIASAAGISVIALAGPRNFEMVKKCGAKGLFDYADADIVGKVVAAVKEAGGEFVGIFDAIATEEPYKIDLAILEKLGGGHLACSHPPPAEVPENVTAGMIFAVNDVATPVWKEYVTPALEKGKLLCLPPPKVVGKGLEFIDEALKTSKTGVSATKLVVEL